MKKFKVGDIVEVSSETEHGKNGIVRETFPFRAKILRIEGEEIYIESETQRKWFVEKKMVTFISRENPFEVGDTIRRTSLSDGSTVQGVVGRIDSSGYCFSRGGVVLYIPQDEGQAWETELIKAAPEKVVEEPGAIYGRGSYVYHRAIWMGGEWLVVRGNAVDIRDTDYVQQLVTEEDWSRTNPATNEPF